MKAKFQIYIGILAAPILMGGCAMSPKPLDNSLVEEASGLRFSTFVERYVESDTFLLRQMGSWAVPVKERLMNSHLYGYYADLVYLANYSKSEEEKIVDAMSRALDVYCERHGGKTELGALPIKNVYGEPREIPNVRFCNRHSGQRIAAFNHHGVFKKAFMFYDETSLVSGQASHDKAVANKQAEQAERDRKRQEIEARSATIRQNPKVGAWVSASLSSWKIDNCEGCEFITLPIRRHVKSGNLYLEGQIVDVDFPMVNIRSSNTNLGDVWVPASFLAAFPE